MPDRFAAAGTGHGSPRRRRWWRRPWRGRFRRRWRWRCADGRRWRWSCDARRRRGRRHVAPHERAAHVEFAPVRESTDAESAFDVASILRRRRWRRRMQRPSMPTSRPSMPRRQSSLGRHATQHALLRRRWQSTQLRRRGRFRVASRYQLAEHRRQPSRDATRRRRRRRVGPALTFPAAVAPAAAIVRSSAGRPADSVRSPAIVLAAWNAPAPARVPRQELAPRPVIDPTSPAIVPAKARATRPGTRPGGPSAGDLGDFLGMNRPISPGAGGRPGAGNRPGDGGLAGTRPGTRPGDLTRPGGGRPGDGNLPVVLAMAIVLADRATVIAPAVPAMGDRPGRPARADRPGTARRRRSSAGGGGDRPGGGEATARRRR